MDKVLITGATGFVGSNLSSFFKDSNYRVEPLSLRNSDWKENIAPADVFVNLAGKAHDHKGEATENDFFEANYELAKQLYGCFINSNASLFIHLSSIAALEEENAKDIISEEHTPNPKSYYGRSKRIAEEFLLEQIIPEGKKIVILRPTMIHGPGDKGNLKLLYKIISKGIPYPLGAFDNKRSFIGIDNLCFIIQKVIEKKDVITSGVYNVADDEPLSTLDIIKTIARISNKKALVLKIHKLLVNFFAKTGDVLKLPLNSKRLVKMTSSLIVSNAAIKQAVAIEKFPLTAQEGLDKTIRSFIS